MYLQILVHHIHGPDKEALTRATQGLQEGEDGRQCCDDHDPDHDHTQDDIEAVTPKKQRWWQRTGEEGQIRLPEGVDAVFGPSVPAQGRRTNKKDNGVSTPQLIETDPAGLTHRYANPPRRPTTTRRTG